MIPGSRARLNIECGKNKSFFFFLTLLNGKEYSGGGKVFGNRYK